MMDAHSSAVDDVRMEPSESHASDDHQDVNCQSTANGVTDYENDELSNNDEHIAVSNSPENQSADMSAMLLAATNRDDTLVDGSNGQSVPVTQSLAGNSRQVVALMDNVTDSHSCEDFDDDRDPNYATQRPDTLGAINVATASTASTFAGPAYQVSAAARTWPVQSAVEDSSFGGDGSAHLGRRTSGAGMDEVELNQRQLMNCDDVAGSDDSSESCDDDNDDDDDDDDDVNGLGSGHQCESTEADQYKMDPEADQSAATVGQPLSSATELQQSGSILLNVDDVRAGACGCSLGQRHRTDGAVSDVSHDMDDPEEDQADRAVSIDNAQLEPAASVPLLRPSEVVPVVCDEHKYGALKQHPQSAFSIPKPRVTKSKAVESELNWPVPSVCQSKSNTDIVFKPIGTSVGKSNSVLRTVVTCKASDGVSVTGTMRGAFTHHAQVLAQDGAMSQDKKDAYRGNESNCHDPSKPALASERSLWSREPLWNTADPAFVLWNDAYTSSSISLPSERHLPGDTGAFAPAISSSQQATPQKTDIHACHMVDNNLDMSPIQPASSSSSRPLSVNGQHAPVNHTELYFGTQGSTPLYSHKVCPIYFFVIFVGIVIFWSDLCAVWFYVQLFCYCFVHLSIKIYM